MAKQKFIIKDWAGNILHYTGRSMRPEFAVAMEFANWDAAEEWLSEALGDAYDESRCEYSIVTQDA